MLEIENISKQYADHLALDHVSMSIPHGKIFGLLGPNGAGKTSLIRIINQITGPDSGTIYFDGEALGPHHISQIGYLPEERGLYKKMKVGEQMIYLAQLKGMTKREAKVKLDFWFERMQMNGWWNRTIEDLSKGMQQKVQFISTVLHEPKLIILDEPFSGFDPVNAQIIQDEILRLNENGATVIYSTHRMETVEELCDNIALLNRSRKVLEGSPQEIKKRYNNHIYEISYESKEGNTIMIEYPHLFEILSHQHHHEEYLIKIKLKDSIIINEVIQSIIDQVCIKQIKEILPSIHDIFIEQVTVAPASSYE